LHYPIDSKGNFKITKKIETTLNNVNNDITLEDLQHKYYKGKYNIKNYYPISFSVKRFKDDIIETLVCEEILYFRKNFLFFFLFLI
jgi:hypothetical protein